MRTGLIVALAILLLATAGGVAVEHATGDVAERYTAAGHELLALTEVGEFDRLTDACNAYEADWKHTMDWLTMLVNHDDADAVTLALLDVKAGAIAQDSAACAAAAIRLTEEAEHLHHRDSFSLGNIL